MDFVRFPVDDESALVLVGLAPELVPDEAPDEAPILGPFTDFLQQVALNGALYGTTGAATFEGLKAIARQLRQRGIILPKPQASLDDVVRTLRDTFTQAGHTGPVTITESTQQPDDGWEVKGTVGGDSFTARADPSGQVIHYRIG